MAQEIERKYLVSSEEFKAQAGKSVRIIQGYLSSVPERTVRVRVKGDKGFLTIKGIGNESGASRYEWEKEISVEEAQELLKICEPGVIDKTRYLVDHQGHIFEVDEFYGSNQGLTVAEVELTDEAQTVNKPSWLAEEVTGDARYYNSMLMKQPFTQW
ncbi:CYTH domain-containing protein [Shewanella sp. 1_MG-2023]|uniref:CYTH domain-containing protein n=1 Tax=Shewanella electrodiphila TaxID=934143 RepID=A0ABT0KTL9_9GAMM|nr:MULTISPECIES: CYTH domain-containing protein [Shewanella]MCL1047185.1 CYTH domain-containing protein [Shewanella electrodiphila]MDO6612728.1 CYTH domain-containing protein [Shewanella sp. 7_MG-2023]MDO6772689.1 CYTH domain-containing protein [Shewanella sp. 2_MG-2023]MDO6794853.1 CYTH domain-containing protein [Shewanella sp. 1_MG-2023]PMG77558.1 adenylate cyclase [Shewanella sp. 10N.286.51.B7]